MPDVQIPKRLQSLMHILITTGRVPMHTEPDLLRAAGLSPARLPVYITELRRLGTKIETIRSNRKTVEYRLAPTEQ